MNNHKVFILSVGLLLMTYTGMARDFNSSLKLKVFIREAGDIPDRLVGFTPAQKNKPAHIPEGKLWYVRPIGALSSAQLDQLAHEMKRAVIPGLDLSDHWELSDSSLGHLTMLSHLQMLDISRTRFTDRAIEQLKKFKRLMVLVLPAGITDHAAENIRQISSLVELGLDESRVTNGGLSEIVHLPLLEILDLSSTQVTDKGIAELQNSPHLRRLTLGGLITDGAAPFLSKLKTLKEIDLSQTQVGDQGLSALSHLPKLQSVYLGRNVTNQGLSNLSASPSLKVLDLSRTPITDEGVQAIAKMKTLEELSLSQTSIGDHSLAALAQMTNLRILDLSDTHVTPAGLVPLARLKKLEILSLSWKTLTHEDLEGMSKLKQVRTIVLNGVPIPEATMAKLRQLTPWESVAELGASPMPKASGVDALAMAVPFSTHESNLKAGDITGIPKPTSALLAPDSVTDSTLSSRKRSSSKSAFQSDDRKSPTLTARVPRHSADEFALAPTRPDRISALSNSRSAITPGTSSLKEANAKPAVRSSGDHSPEAAQGGIPGAASAPAEVASKGEVDNLLQSIRLQSNPAKGGTFSGLAGMRQVQRTETLASLDHLSMENVASQAKESDPGTSLGEFSVGASRRKH